ncbi:MAG: CxxxxCH/CxxCH domain-containing protein [Nitrospirota bacterium]
MRMKTTRTQISSGWLAKVSRLLIFTATLGVLLAAGLAGPQDATATVTVGAEFSAPTASVATGIGSMAAITGTFAVGAGQNRLLVVVAQWEAAAAANTSSFTSGTWGGQNLTSLFNTFNSGVSRNRQWIGYLRETQIRAAVGTTLNLNITNSVAPAGWQVKAAWYTGVNQTTPINHFVNNNLETAPTVTHNFGATPLNVINGGRAYYFETSNGGVTYTPMPGWTEMYDGNDPSANMSRTCGGVLISTTTTTNPLLTQSAATRNTISGISLNPAITNVGNGTGFPANKTVFANDTNQAVDSFTLFTTGFTDTLSQVVVVGTNTANVTASGVKIYRDSGGTANEWDATDTLMATSTFSAGTATFTTFSTPIAATTTTTQYIVTYNIIGSPTVSQTLTGLVTSATGSNTTLLNDTTSATLTIGSSDSTAPTPGTVTVTPDTGTYINANPTITTTFTDNESSVTNCWYTTDGTWPGTAGALSGSSPTWTCTANPAALAGAVTLNMRALSTGGTGTASALSRTVDSTVPTDGTLTVTPGDTLNDLSWPGFADAASGLRSANTYTIRFLTGASAPANCGTGSVVTGYGGTATVFSHTGLVNGTQYSYRICAYDNVNNGPSAGATGSGTPASSPPDQLTASGNTPLATTPKTDTAAFVLMQRFAMNSNNTGNGSVRLTGLGIDDIGTAGTIAAVRIYTSLTLSTGIPSDAALIGRISNWPGTPQVINLNTGTVADRTVVTGPTSTKYGYVVYDMFDGTTGLTTRASVTALYAASPDTVNAFASFLSNTITLTTGIKATVTACTDCHGNPPVDGPRSATTGSFLGSHTQHANSQPANLGLACTICHRDNGTNTGHRDGSIDMLKTFATFSGSYSKGTISAGTLKSFPQVDNPAFTTCTTVYCHSTVQGAGGSGAGTDKPQTWGAAGPLACGACHLNMRTDPTAPGSHVAHAQTAVIACNSCHTGYTENSVTMSTHANYTIEVNSGLTYTNSGVPGNGYGACATAVGCHTSAYSSGTVTTPLWGITSGCDACHRTPGAFATYGSPSWGSHGKHVDSQGYLCNACHVGAVKDVSGGANHVDGNIDVTNGYPVTAKHSPGSGYSACTNASCHGSPYSPATAVTPVWGVAGAGCGSCHGAPGAFASYGSPTWGSHGKHVDSQGYGCNECHTSTALKDVSGGAEHGDGNIDVYAVTPYDLKYGSGPTITKHSPGSGYTRCFNASCHASPYGAVTAVTPSWGVAGPGCTMCHIAPGAFASYGSPTWGAHGKHLNTYNFVCGDCHTGAVDGVSGGVQHGDNNIDVANGYPPDVAKHSPGTYTGNCSNFYCHSKGVSIASTLVPTFTMAQNWGGTTACNSCHGNEPGNDGSGRPLYPSPKHYPSTVSVVTGWTSTMVTRSTYTYSTILREDGTNITYTGTTLQPLVVTNFTFSTSELADADVITGYSVIVKGLSTGVGSISAQLTDNATATPTGIAGAAKLFTLPTTTDEVVVNTAVNDTWGATMTPAQVRNANFGVIIKDNDATNSNIQIDAIKVVVHTNRTKMNSHLSHDIYNCNICHYNVTTTSTSITNTSLHVNQAYNLAQGPATTINYAYSPTGGACSTSSCHQNAVPAKWGVDDLDCVGCHLIVQTAPTASLLTGGTVTQRRAVSAEFQNNWSHKRSAQGNVTKWDCIVCHLEGSPTSSGREDQTLHQNGYINLRDPDTGTGMLGVTSFTAPSGTTYPGGYVDSASSTSFTIFTRNLNTRLENDPKWLTIAAIQKNFCLKCHDSNGATSTLAQVPVSYGSSTSKPFGTTISGATYSSFLTANNVLGGVTNISSHFSTSNSSYHPVLGKQNNSYATATRMTATYNPVTLKTASTLTGWGALMSCWDCHAMNGASGTIRSMVTSHGSPTTVRGSYYVASPTLCLLCHIGGYTNASQHGAGSAVTTAASNMNATTFSSCHNCHLSNTTRPARPVPAQDAHGFNGLLAAGQPAWTWGNGNGMRPIAFIRNTARFTTVSPRPRAAPGITTGTATCGGASPTGCSDDMSQYTPGGRY